MSDTPRTHEFIDSFIELEYDDVLEHMGELEIELNQANKRIEELEGAIREHRDSFSLATVQQEAQDEDLWKILNKEGN